MASCNSDIHRKQLGVRSESEPEIASDTDNTALQQSTYDKARQFWIRPFVKRQGHKPHPETLLVLKDTALLTYLDDLTERHGVLSESTTRNAVKAVRHFLRYYGKEITDHALADLVEWKRQNPMSKDIEFSLKKFSMIQPHVKCQRFWASNILGIFKANFAHLSVKIRTHYERETEPISEGIIKALYHELKTNTKTYEHWLLFALQAYAGQRIKCLATLPVDRIQIETFNEFQLGDLALFFIELIENKSRFKHFCIIPKWLAEELLQMAKLGNRTVLFPEYETLWKEIKVIAREKFNINISSKYLRNRFETRADDTAISKNKTCFLMGSKPQQGHLPLIYLLKEIPNYLDQYRTYLVPALSFDNSQDHEPEQSKELLNNSHIARLEAENSKLRELVTQLLQNKN